jgi:cephalosporin hydroxylase
MKSPNCVDVENPRRHRHETVIADLRIWCVPAMTGLALYAGGYRPVVDSRSFDHPSPERVAKSANFP